MGQLKRKQHYIWKEYLKAWCSDNQIHAYLKASNKSIFSSLDGVAQERFFYSLQEYTLEEEVILKEIVESFSGQGVKDLNLEFYEALTIYSKIKRELNTKDLPTENLHYLNKKLGIIQKNTLEDIHANVESLGKQLIAADSIEELNRLFADPSRIMSFTFICMQYHRTKKMKNAYISFAKNYKYQNEKYADLISIILSNGLAWGLAFYHASKIVLLKNKTTIPLLTGDQPAINMKHHLKDERGFVASFELYYPISPNKALLFQVEGTENSITESSLSSEEVIRFNKAILEHSEYFVFGTKDSIFTI